MEMKTLVDMTTSAMVAEYNALTGKDIKKFATRGAGEAQLIKARIAYRKAQAAVSGEVEMSNEATNEVNKGQDATGAATQSAPVTSQKTAKTAEEKAARKAAVDKRKAEIVEEKAAAKAAREAKKAAKALEPVKPVRSRAEGVSESWNDPAVAEKRKARAGVRVGGVEYKSTAAAFEALDLPMNKHIKFRAGLKATGSAAFEHDGKTFDFETFSIEKPVKAEKPKKEPKAKKPTKKELAAQAAALAAQNEESDTEADNNQN